MKKNLPKISLVTCTYNGDRIIREFLEHIFMQDYPKNKMEMIIADGGSTDKTLEIIKEFQEKYPKVIKLFHNEKRFPDGKGMGVDTFSRKAIGEMILLMDQDNILVQKNWISGMVQILIDNKNILGVQTRMAIPNKGSAIDKYFAAVAIEDPFAIPYSLNAQIVFNPQKFKYSKEGKFFVYTADKNNFYYAGGNGFLMRKKEYLESGGYTQDIDNFYRMALSKKKYKIAVPKNLKLYHKSSVSFKHLIEKRTFYIGHYLMENYQDRDFYWFDMKKNNFSQNFRFIKNVFNNLILIPNIYDALRMYSKRRESFWLVHPFVMFSISLSYILKFFQARFFGKQKEANI